LFGWEAERRKYHKERMNERKDRKSAENERRKGNETKANITKKDNEEQRKNRKRQTLLLHTRGKRDRIKSPALNNIYTF
jgi:hypothetical protein